MGDPALCLSPPYDQFDPEMIARLEAQSQYNIARIVKAPPDGHPDPTGQRYNRANAFLARWVSEKALVPDDRPGFYPYSQSYTVGATRLTRRGFIALGDIRDAGVYTHEETHSHVREDRCRLRLATEADFGLIFMIYSDPAQTIDRILRDCETGDLLLAVDQPDGSAHRLYRCADPDRSEHIVRLMAGMDCVIADGHHRTAAAFDSWKKTGDERFGYVMTAFFNADAPGMTVLPIHRVVAREHGWRFTEFLEQLADRFKVHHLPTDGQTPRQIAAHLEGLIAERQRRDLVAFGMIGPDPGFVFLVETTRTSTTDWPWPPQTSAAWRGLATAIFETGILRATLGYSDDQIAVGHGLDFPKDSPRVVELVQSDHDQLGFILPATPLASIFEVARLRQNLPQKSTFFFPKLLTGLTIHRMEPLVLD